MRPFSHSLPMALLRARESAMRRFRPLLARHDLTEQQWRVLRALASTDHPLTVGELVDHTFLLGPSLSRILANLADRSLVERRANQRDQRSAHVALTGSGRALVSEVGPESETIYSRIEAEFGVDRLAALLDELTALAALEPEVDATDNDRFEAAS